MPATTRLFPTNNAKRIYYWVELKSIRSWNLSCCLTEILAMVWAVNEYQKALTECIYQADWLKHLAIEIMNLKIFLLTLFPHPRSHPPEGRLLWQGWWHRKMPRSTWNFSYFFLIITECNFISSKEFESWQMQVTSIWHMSQFSKYQVQDTSNS